MTPREVSLVQQSFATIIPCLDSFSHVFYARLFEQNPNLDLLFRSDAGERESRLGDMLLRVVLCLERIETLEPEIARLGRRHQEYGVRPDDFVRYWRALDWTLERFLDGDYSPEVRAAWAGFFTSLTGIMLDGYAPASTGGSDGPAAVRSPPGTF